MWDFAFFVLGKTFTDPNLPAKFLLFCVHPLFRNWLLNTSTQYFLMNVFHSHYFFHFHITGWKLTRSCIVSRLILSRPMWLLWTNFLSIGVRLCSLTILIVVFFKKNCKPPTDSGYMSSTYCVHSTCLLMFPVHVTLRSKNVWKQTLLKYLVRL